MTTFATGAEDVLNNLELSEESKPLLDDRYELVPGGATGVGIR